MAFMVGEEQAFFYTEIPFLSWSPLMSIQQDPVSETNKRGYLPGALVTFLIVLPEHLAEAP